MRPPSIPIRLGSLTRVRWKPHGDGQERGAEPTPRVEGMGIERFTPHTRPRNQLLPASPRLLRAGGSGHTPSPAQTCAPALGSSGWQAEGPVPGSGRSQGPSRAAQDLERIKLHQGKSQRREQAAAPKPLWGRHPQLYPDCPRSLLMPIWASPQDGPGLVAPPVHGSLPNVVTGHRQCQLRHRACLSPRPRPHPGSSPQSESPPLGPLWVTCCPWGPPEGSLSLLPYTFPTVTPPPTLPLLPGGGQGAQQLIPTEHPIYSKIRGTREGMKS